MFIYLSIYFLKVGTWEGSITPFFFPFSGGITYWVAFVGLESSFGSEFNRRSLGYSHAIVWIIWRERNKSLDGGDISCAQYEL